MESAAKDLIRSDDDFFEPPQMQFFALRRLFGYFAIRACDMGLYCSPWMVWSLFGTLATLFLCIAPFYTPSDIDADELTDGVENRAAAFSGQHRAVVD